ncbi:hypothetical protein EYD45_01445 [Hyunsoonleella flava]|uniref:SMI1/KNR4 family protein n=1 Tax=Hyunsoonleella flava TaxID=2527939 RepID=A0A4Q9FLH2_9FLAO|nr:SMI1/KNR4 family protein [Hyunsoonleella flava]TBN06577.1 hypothetical protein EYD45_01445 [Hyunsoonleella flava]
MFDELKQHSADNLGQGTDENLILQLEAVLDIKIPDQFRVYLLEVGYAEIFGDEIYSIYEVPDLIPCNGLHWMNKDNPHISRGFLEFFSNDIDGTFYINCSTGQV